MKLVGGVKSNYALPVCIVVGCFAIASALPVTYIKDNFYIVIGMLWGVLFFGAMILPSLTGIMLDCLEDDLKAKGNSFANLSYNLLGYLPAPFLYGMVRDYF